MDRGKPAGWAAEYGAWFQLASVADRYDRRPPYPAETFDILESLTAEPHVALDAGCGIGDLARPLAQRLERVDAVDQSGRMVEHGRRLDGGDSPKLRWLASPIEEAPLEPPYGLITAGDSIHWFDWQAVMRRFVDALAPRGVLAIVGRDWLGRYGLKARLRPIYARHGANPDFAPLDPVVELTRRGFFEPIGQTATQPSPWQPTVEEFLACHHSQAGFVLEKMSSPADFDGDIAAAIHDLPQTGGRFHFDVRAVITWGKPLAGPQPGAS